MADSCLIVITTPLLALELATAVDCIAAKGLVASGQHKAPPGAGPMRALELSPELMRQRRADGATVHGKAAEDEEDQPLLK